MLLAFLLALPSTQAASYEVDASHSRVGFSVVHMTISTVRGSFGSVVGSVEYDEKNVSATKVSGTITVSSVSTGEAKRDAHLVGADFFDAAGFPTMTFTSTSVKNVSATGFDLVGNLTMRGVTKEVTLHLDPFSAEIKDPWGGTRRATKAKGTLNRKDFGVSWSAMMDGGGFVVSDEVQIELDIELKKI